MQMCCRRMNGLYPKMRNDRFCCVVHGEEALEVEQRSLK